MNKNILVIATSLRENSNSEALGDAFIKGAKKAGHDIEKICLKGKTINFCRGCLACQKTHQCVIKDDADEIIQKIRKADAVVFATPIYYYEMSGQMKTLIDRLNPLYGEDYSFRDIYLLSTAADKDECATDGAVKGIMGFIKCFNKTRLAGTVFAGGVEAPGDITDSVVLQTSYELGLNA